MRWRIPAAMTLAALILRPVALTFRSKLEDARWRRAWDWAFFVSGLVPALVFGVAFGNLFLGVPFRFDDTLRVTYTGGLFGLLSPWALLCGLVSLVMLAMHGGTWIALKTEGPLARRSHAAAAWAAVALIVLFSVAGLWLAFGIRGYAIQGPIASAGPADPPRARRRVDAGRRAAGRGCPHGGGAAQRRRSGFGVRARSAGCPGRTGPAGARSGAGQVRRTALPGPGAHA